MIIKKKESEILTNELGAQFSIDQVDPEVFVQMLLNLYSDPKGSIIRETVSNAYDSNIKAGSTTPVVVGVENNVLFVQDFGSGLSEEFMLTKYTQIGYSDKRSDANAIGWYGYGN